MTLNADLIISNVNMHIGHRRLASQLNICAKRVMLLRYQRPNAPTNQRITGRGHKR